MTNTRMVKRPLCVTIKVAYYFCLCQQFLSQTLVNVHYYYTFTYEIFQLAYPDGFPLATQVIVINISPHQNHGMKPEAFVNLLLQMEKKEILHQRGIASPTPSLQQSHQNTFGSVAIRTSLLGSGSGVTGRGGGTARGRLVSPMMKTKTMSPSTLRHLAGGMMKMYTLKRGSYANTKVKALLFFIMILIL